MQTQTSEKPEFKPVASILATSESLSDLRTIPESQDSSANLKPKEKLSPEALLKKKQNWQAKWLSMDPHHPQIKILLDRLYEFCAGYAARPTRGRTLILFGENGCGKTKALRCVMDWACSIALKIPLVEREDLDGTTGLAKTQFAHWPAIVDGFHKNQFDSCEALRQCQLLLLDDIGAEHDPSGFGSEQLYLILCKREFKWNVITTNVHKDKWAETFERRIASRLFRNADHVDLSQVPDYSTI